MPPSLFWRGQRTKSLLNTDYGILDEITEVFQSGFFRPSVTPGTPRMRLLPRLRIDADSNTSNCFSLFIRVAMLFPLEYDETLRNQDTYTIIYATCLTKIYQTHVVQRALGSPFAWAQESASPSLSGDHILGAFVVKRFAASKPHAMSNAKSGRIPYLLDRCATFYINNSANPAAHSLIHEAIRQLAALWCTVTTFEIFP